MEQEGHSLSDYLAILRRRKWQMALVTFVMLLLSVSLAFGLPAIYRSGATILIEQQEIPQELVRSTVTTYANQRIQIISQRVMTSSNMLRIIDRYGLYADSRAKDPIETVIERMREKISMDTVSADVVDPRSGRPTEATIAFTLSYDNESPGLAQEVASELANLFLNENITSRQKLAAETSDFLSEEANRLSAVISDLEEQLAAFKERNSGSLPEQVQLNLQLMDRAERELIEVQRQIRDMNERQVYLEAELAQLSPTSMLYTQTGQRILGMEDQLKVLQTEYASLSARYSSEHPDVVKMRREIAALSSQSGGADASNELSKQLTAVETELATARQSYSSEHPDVKRLERSAEGLRRQIASTPSAPVRAPVTKPDNPAYIQIQARAQAARSEGSSLNVRATELREKLASYEQRLIESPQVEREYRGLARSYEDALSKYAEIKAKQNQAQLAEALEVERKGERFTLIEPPQLPATPEKPNRMIFLIGGLMLSFAGGIGSAAVTEAMDDSVWGRKGVISVVGVPPLAVVPYIKNSTDTWRRLWRWMAILAALTTVAAAAVFMVHQFIMPLDVLWFSVLRRSGL